MSEVTITLNDETKRDELLDLMSNLPYVAAVRIENGHDAVASGANALPSPTNGTQGISPAHKPNGASPQADPLDHEVAVFEEQHDRLVKEFLGQYIAMYQGVVIAHHADLDSLIINVHKTHPGALVLFRPVRETLPPPLIFRSPRMDKR